LGDDNTFKLAANFVDAFGFEAEHGEPFGQFLGRLVEINVLFEPVEGDFHAKTLMVLRLAIIIKTGEPTREIVIHSD
jgi:hypothetical protein